MTCLRICCLVGLIRCLPLWEKDLIRRMFNSMLKSLVLLIM